MLICQRYHSHSRGQYPDGLRQALVITDPENPYAGQYDEERLFSVSDWYHDQMPYLLEEFINVANPTGKYNTLAYHVLTY